jgi:hypothetical protein
MAEWVEHAHECAHGGGSKPAWVRLDLLSALLCKVGVCRPCVRAIRFRGTLDEC